jgi:transcriptional regulator NrdR family protein
LTESWKEDCKCYGSFSESDLKRIEETASCAISIHSSFLTIRVPAPRLRHELKVIKKNGSEVDFNPRKLRKSIVMACEAAEINDDDLPVMVTHRVVTALRSSEGTVVTTDQIKDEVFNQLSHLSSELDMTYRDAFKKDAGRLMEVWRRREQIKNGEKDTERDELFKQQEDELSACKSNVFRLEAEVASLRQRQSEAAEPCFESENASFGSVLDAVLAAEKSFSDLLIIHENARQRRRIAHTGIRGRSTRRSNAWPNMSERNSTPSQAPDSRDKLDCTSGGRSTLRSNARTMNRKRL